MSQPLHTRIANAVLNTLAILGLAAVLVAVAVGFAMGASL